MTPLPLTLEASTLPLTLRRPFQIAHGTSTVRENLAVRVSDGTYVGLGEGAVVPYYGEDICRSLSELAPAQVPRLVAEAIAPAVDADLLTLSRALMQAEAFSRLSRASRTAIDLAVHDLCAKRAHGSLSALLRIPRATSPLCTWITVATDRDESSYIQALAERADWPKVKLKLGSGDPAWDVRMVELARTTCAGVISVDVNTGWTLDVARSLVPRLGALGVAFIEQPLPVASPREDWIELASLCRAAGTTLVADESACSVADVQALAGVVDMVNIKLFKWGGLGHARAGIDLCRNLGLRVMLGCMIESAIAITAAAALAPLCDELDLDAPALVTNDPAGRIELVRGELRLNPD